MKRYIVVVWYFGAWAVSSTHDIEGDAISAVGRAFEKKIPALMVDAQEHGIDLALGHGTLRGSHAD